VSRGAAKSYSLLILMAGPNFGTEGADEIICEHGRRNFSLRADGVLRIVCPLPDDSEVCGVAIFDAALDETRKLMDEDPGVQAGLRYELHPCRSFRGDALA